jgi:hypothetical protein
LKRWVRAVFAITLLLWPTALHAQAEKRIALLIGNQAYGNEIGRLTNPHNDVALLERALKGLGFEVTIVRDAGLAGLHQTVNAYARRMQAAGANAVGFFYYSGHGAADGGTNNLIPVDVKTTETGELWTNRSASPRSRANSKRKLATLPTLSSSMPAATH